MTPDGGPGADGWPDPMPGNGGAPHDAHGPSADDWATAASAGWPDPMPANGQGGVAVHGLSGDDRWATAASAGWPEPVSPNGNGHSRSVDAWDGPGEPSRRARAAGPGGTQGTLADPDPAPAGPSPVRQAFVPPPETLDLDPDLFPELREPAPPVPDAPDLSRLGPAPRRPPARPAHRTGIDRRRLAVVYDIEGPRVRLGIAWFLGALVAVAASPFTAALVYAAAAGLAARQVARAWGTMSWEADLAAGLGAVPVLAALAGTPVAVAALVLAVVVAAAAALAPDGARLPGGAGRLAAAGVLATAAVPALAGASLVMVRSDSVVAAVVLVLVASAYEMGDYIVGSGSSNTVEGPLAGLTTATLLALPLAILLLEPYDAAGPALLAFTALACPLGQIVASAILPGAGAPAPALRRIDTLIVLAPLWAVAAGAL